MRVRRRAVRWLALLASLGIAAPLLVLSGAAGSAPDNQGTVHREQEMDISGNGSTMNVGEPEIAVNPRNPSQMFVDGATFPVPVVLNINAALPVPDPCQGWSSDNGGSSWQPAPLPPKLCNEDGVAVFGPDGTLYAGGNVATTTSIVPCTTPGTINFGGVCILVQGYDPVFTSKDGGHTWSAPVYTMGSTNLVPNGTPFPFAPNSGNPVNTFDRPWLAMDQSTNTLYAIGHNIADHEGFVTASTNEARSFGPIYAIDSPAYPSGGLFGGTIAAEGGMLAVAYTATSAPGAQCPCVIFETSRDHGATFTRHVVPTVNPAAQPFPFVAVDPRSPGHFALTIFDATGTENQVYTTDDFGATWHGPTAVAEAPPNQQFKPWLSYGPDGQLLLVWRTWHGAPNTSPYDVWLAVGRDEGRNGAVFGTPVRVSSEAAAYPPGYTAGDDFSWVTATRNTVLVGWGDSRDATGPFAEGAGVQMWIARIPLSGFGHP
jgi:hypothetical protein